MNYRAVLFDLDGTLLDTLDDLADSVNEALERLGLPGHPTRAYKVFVGDGMETLAHRSLPEDRRDDDTVRKLVDLMGETYAGGWDRKTRPYPGVPEMLDDLAARGLRMAVLSNKPDGFTKLCVDSLLSRWQFDPVMGARKGVPHKPDPTGALAIASEIAVAPADFLYLGDTNTDMKTALAAGMFPVGALWGFRSAEELEASGAKALVTKPADLLALLN